MGRIKGFLPAIVVLAALAEPAVSQFSEQRVISTQVDGATQVYTADLDGDGDLDVVSVSQLDNKIAWYENLNSLGEFGEQRLVSLEAFRPNAVHVADLDGDGSLDVVSASMGDDKIAWYPNQGGGVFGGQLVISTEVLVPQSVYAADLDGDGDLDVVSASRDDDKIAWYENTDGAGDFGTQRVVSTDAFWANRVLALDIDGDGDLDIVSASEQDDKIAWYENLDGAGAFSEEIVITLNADAIRDLQAADIDGDGDPDLLAASSADDRVDWYENTAGVFSAEKVVTTEADFAQAVYAADIDLDGDLDVLSASINDSKIAWYENLDGLGNFGGQQLISSAASGAVAVIAANVDGDEDPDIISASAFDDKIAWYESFAGRGRVLFSAFKVIGGSPQAFGAHAVSGADIDGDGDRDVLSASFDDNKIAWYRNDDGNPGAQRVVTLEALGARDVAAADIDGDGDQDILSASGLDNSIRWYENLDGQGNFDSGYLINDNANDAYAVYAADLDGDGDQDVLSASSADDKIAWYENQNGRGNFRSPVVISKAAKGATDVIAVDLDGDGDLDVASASTFDDKIAWYENVDGAGKFSTQKVVSTDADLAIAVHAADIDRDGDMDILSASSGDDKIAWYENLDGLGVFGPQRIVSIQAARAFSVYTADLNGDGDPDIISGSRDDNTVAWYENQGGGVFGAGQIITNTAMGVRSVTAFDMDLDGDPDVLSASQDDHTIAWYENMSLDYDALSSHVPDQPAAGFELSQVYPNPFQREARLNLQVDRSQSVNVVVYDIQGRLVEVIFGGMLPGGQLQALTFEIEKRAAGLYVIRLEGEFFHATRKCVLIP